MPKSCSFYNFLFCFTFFVLCCGCNNSPQRYDKDKMIKISRIEISKFLGEGHKKAAIALTKGEINSDSYQRITDNWVKYYSELLINVNLAEYTMFVWSQEDNNDSNLKLLKREYSADLQKEILCALNNGNLHISLGKIGNTIGLMLTITPVDANSIYKKVFIENLCYQDSERVFE